MKKIILVLSLIFYLEAKASETPLLDEAANQYVQLVLALGEHDPNYVDAYYGPESWRETAKKNQISLKNIIIAAKVVQDVVLQHVSEDPLIALRIKYLNEQLSALVAKALMLNGSVDYNFDEQAKALYGTTPPVNSLQSFEPVLQALENLLPGESPLIERVDAFRALFVIPTDKLEAVFNVAIKACRDKTRQYLSLPEKENFKMEFVQDKPWSGYNWYQGGSYSLIQINTDLPIEISRAVDLGCHEGYPGHHTYNALLEDRLYRKMGWVEYSVYPLYSPQSLIAEGSANYGIEMAFPGEERLEFEKNVLYPIAGIDPKLAEKYSKVSELLARLTYAANEVARQYINGKIDAYQAAKMLQRYALMSEGKAKQRVQFFDKYGAYVINYNWGKDLVKNWVEANSKTDTQSEKDRWSRFESLLSSPRLPSSLNR